MKYKKAIFLSLILLLAFVSGLFLYESVTAFLIYQPQVPANITTSNLTVCGNNICEIGEDATSCPLDCQEIVSETPSIKGGLRLVNPTVAGPNSSKEIYLNDNVKFYTFVEKLGDANISKVWCILKLPSGKLETIDMISNGVWSNSIQVKELGTFVVIFNAVDESNTYAEQVLLTFSVYDKTAPTGFTFFGASMPSSAY